LVAPYWFDGVTQTYCDIYPDDKWVILDAGPTHRIQNAYTLKCLVGNTASFYNATLATTSKNRIHFDLRAPGPVTHEVARLTGLGATLLRVGDDLTVMADPEGNEFCVE